MPVDHAKVKALMRANLFRTLMTGYEHLSRWELVCFINEMEDLATKLGTKMREKRLAEGNWP